MPTRDEHGNYVNDEGVTIKIKEYKDGSGVKVSFYDKNPETDDHKSVHAHLKNDGSFKAEDNVNGKNETTEGKCYLTTACISHYKDNFDDNCYELRVLRWFRDNYVSRADVEIYQEVAPNIVSSINSQTHSNLIYNYIYDNVVDACVEAIENGNYDFAYNRYKDSLMAMQEKFTKNTQPKLVKTLV